MVLNEASSWYNIRPYSTIQGRSWRQIHTSTQPRDLFLSRICKDIIWKTSKIFLTEIWKLFLGDLLFDSVLRTIRIGSQCSLDILKPFVYKCSNNGLRKMVIYEKELAAMWPRGSRLPALHRDRSIAEPIIAAVAGVPHRDRSIAGANHSGGSGPTATSPRPSCLWLH